MPVSLFIMPATPIVTLFIGSPNTKSGHKKISSKTKYFIARALSMVQMRCKALNQDAPEIRQTPGLVLLSFLATCPYSMLRYFATTLQNYSSRTSSPVHHPKPGASRRVQLNDQQHRTENSHYKPHFPKSSHRG
jgi:hypothetical protein